MSCGKLTCQSGGCTNSNSDNSEPTLSPSPSPTTRSNGNNLCLKCKSNEAVAGGLGGGESGCFCVPCFRGSLFGKFRLAVTSNAMIDPSDKVLVAFSGGAASRVALQFVHEMHDKAQKNFDASRDKSLPVFGVGIAFVDESAAHPVPTEEVGEAIQHVKTVALDLSPPEKELHIAPLECIFSSNLTDGRNMLREVLGAVCDNTGREDLLTHLRMLCLQKVAFENGYNKLVLGSCTSTIARHVLSATVKGQGYSLPADIQYVDARWEIPVLLPLRDCLAQELNTLCLLDGLKTLPAVNGPQSGINALVSSFVSLLQAENPSRECTIVRTAGKLTPFSFNKLPDVDDPKARLASQRRHKKFNIKQDESASTESFCSLCNGPLHVSDLSKSINCDNEEKSTDDFGASCCSSCRFQILPNDPSLMEQFYSCLPQPIIVRGTKSRKSLDHGLLRDKIQEFLLSDDEDEA